MDRISAVIFDLDGTLLNTLDDLADSCNRQLEKRGFPLHPADAYRYFVGNGARKLVERALPEGTEKAAIDDFLAEFREDYAASCFEKTRPYPGIPELLSRLKEAGLPLAVLSNKPDTETRRVVDHYFDEELFACVRGQREGIPHKPDPAGPREVLAELGASAAETAFVGDSWIDMRTAAGSGCIPIGVLWGFREKAELVEHGARFLAANTDELETLLL